jgi:hypothetical protein
MSFVNSHFDSRWSSFFLSIFVLLYYIVLFIYIFFFSSPCQRQSELLPSLGVLSSVNFSHFNLLL